MKKKQSKKRWAWTKTQKRKHWSLTHRHSGGGVPRWFCRILDNSDKRKLDRSLKEIKNGLEPDEMIYNPKYNNSSAAWLWW